MATLALNRPPAITWHKLNINEVEVEIADLPLAQGAHISELQAAGDPGAPSGTPRSAARFGESNGLSEPRALHCFVQSLGIFANSENSVPSGMASADGVQRVPDRAPGSPASSEVRRSAARPTSGKPDLGASLPHASTERIPLESADEFGVQTTSEGSPEGSGSAWEAEISNVGLSSALADLGEGPDWLLAHASQRVIATGDAVVDITAQDGKTVVAVVDVDPGEGGRAHVVVHTDSPDGGAGMAGVLVRVHAAAYAQVEVELLQTLGKGFTYLECVAIDEDDDARVTIRQTVLGAGASYVGLASNLEGFRARNGIDVHYAGLGSSVLDFNYAMRQRGAQTQVEFDAQGVLTDSSRKTLRDTIDLIRGCKGAKGREQETVLLANDGVRNKSLPVILCTEDDVQGDHGATIGHVEPEQLHYLNSRGLNQEQVEALFVGAVFDYALAHALTPRSRAAIERLKNVHAGMVPAREGEE